MLSEKRERRKELPESEYKWVKILSFWRRDTNHECANQKVCTHQIIKHKLHDQTKSIHWTLKIWVMSVYFVCLYSLRLSYSWKISSQIRLREITPHTGNIHPCHLRSSMGISAGICEFDVMPNGCFATSGSYVAGTLPLYPTVDTKQAVAMATRALFGGI